MKRFTRKLSLLSSAVMIATMVNTGVVVADESSSPQGGETPAVTSSQTITIKEIVSAQIKVGDEAGRTIAYLEATGGTAPYTFEVVSPQDMFEVTEENKNLIVSKQELTEKNYTIELKVTDSLQNTTTKQIEISVEDKDEVVTLESIEANGVSDRETTTTLTLTFDKDPGDIRNNVTVSNAVVTDVTGQDTTREVVLSDIRATNNSTLTVSIENPYGKDIKIANNQVTIYRGQEAKITKINANQSTSLQEGEENTTVGQRVLSSISAEGGTGKIVFSIAEDTADNFEILHLQNSINESYHLVIKNKPLTEGSYSVTLRAEDELGDSYEESFVIDVEKENPQIETLTGTVAEGLQEEQENTNVGKTVVSNLQATGGTGELYFKLSSLKDKFEIVDGNINIKNAPLTEGSYEIVVVAYDRKGKEKTHSFTIDVAKKQEEVAYEKENQGENSAQEDNKDKSGANEQQNPNQNQEPNKNEDKKDDNKKEENSNQNQGSNQPSTSNQNQEPSKNVDENKQGEKDKNQNSQSSSQVQTPSYGGGGGGGSSSTPAKKVEEKVKKEEAKKEDTSNNKQETKKESEKTILTIGKTSYTVVKDGVSLEKMMDVAPVIKDSRTMLPVRMIAEILGLDVKYNSVTRTATFMSDKDNKIEYTLGNKYMIVNGQKVNLTTEYLNVNGRILLPIRDIQEAFKRLGLESKINWDAKTKSVTVVK